MFESLVNSSSGKTIFNAIRVTVQFESLVNSSSGKTFLTAKTSSDCLRALLIQVVVKQKILCKGRKEV